MDQNWSKFQSMIYFGAKHLIPFIKNLQHFFNNKWIKH